MAGKSRVLTGALMRSRLSPSCREVLADRASIAPPRVVVPHPLRVMRRHPRERKAAPMERPPAQRVEIIVPVRTLLVLLAFAALVGLALLSLGTLLSIF